MADFAYLEEKPGEITQEGGLKAHLCFFCILSLLIQICRGQGESLQKSPWHQPPGDDVISFHISTFSLSHHHYCSRCFHPLIHYFRSKAFDVRTSPGGLVMGVGSFRSAEDKVIADKEPRGPGEMSYLLHR